MNNNEVGNTTLQQMPKKKMLLFTGLTIILVIMVIIGLSARTTINDAKSVLSYNSMRYYTHEDGVLRQQYHWQMEQCSEHKII